MKLTYHQALAIAVPMREALRPHCERIEIAGSIRRQKPEVKDVELVCIPKMGGGMFGDARSDAFSEAVHGLGTIVKGDPSTGRYVQVAVGCIMLDLFITDAERWGWIFLLRTGSAEHNLAMLEWLRRYGYTSKGGRLWTNGAAVATPEEQDVFTRARKQYVEPQHRIA